MSHLPVQRMLQRTFIAQMWSRHPLIAPFHVSHPKGFQAAVLVLDDFGVLHLENPPYDIIIGGHKCGATRWIGLAADLPQASGRHCGCCLLCQACASIWIAHKTGRPGRRLLKVYHGMGTKCQRSDVASLVLTAKDPKVSECINTLYGAWSLTDKVCLTRLSANAKLASSSAGKR
jgi:hypothetical protein